MLDHEIGRLVEFAMRTASRRGDTSSFRFCAVTVTRNDPCITDWGLLQSEIGTVFETGVGAFETGAGVPQLANPASITSARIRMASTSSCPRSPVPSTSRRRGASAPDSSPSLLEKHGTSAQAGAWRIFGTTATLISRMSCIIRETPEGAAPAPPLPQPSCRNVRDGLNPAV